MATPPDYVLAAVRLLDDIWSHYRPERLRLDSRQLQSLSRRWGTSYFLSQRYASPRAAGAEVRMVFWFMPWSAPTLCTDIIHNILDHVQEELKATEVVLVGQRIYNSTRNKALRNCIPPVVVSQLNERMNHWELLHYDEHLGINREFPQGLHRLEIIPRHEILCAPEERAALALLLGQEDWSRLPALPVRTDPVALLLGVRVGDVVRITAPHIITGERISYRVGVSPN